MSILKVLKQPFPYEHTPGNTLGMAAFFGIFVFGFLMVFKPFDLDVFQFNRLLLIASVYGLITFSCVFIATGLLPAIFPGIFNEINWTTGRHILFTLGILFFVGLVNYLVSPWLVDSSLNFSNAIWYQGITLAIGIIPISLMILVRQNRLLKKFSGQADILEQKLKEKREVEETHSTDEKKMISNKIVLSGQYQNERVELYPDDLYFISSASNYIKLFHIEKQKLVYSIIRSTLKSAETTVLEHPNFLKCHRAYIINLDKVVHVEGNAQGYKIRIEGHDDLIPISRNFNNEFSDKLLAFRKHS